MTGIAVILPINLGQFLKAAGVVGGGGDAKALVLSGQVRVNGQTEDRRGRKLAVGDVVAVPGAEVRVEESGASEARDRSPRRDHTAPGGKPGGSSGPRGA